MYWLNLICKNKVCFYNLFIQKMIFKKKNKFDIYAEEYVGDSSPEIKR
jgi:hypothetical protein